MFRFYSNSFSSEMNRGTDTIELGWIVTCAFIAVTLASLPYLWGLLITPSGYVFLGLTHNIDDGAVYLSWIQQIANGKLTYINLFTNEPVVANQFNVLFLLMGLVARFTHIPTVWVYHIFRVLLGIAAILSVWVFSKLFLTSPSARRLLILFLCFSSGVGWLFLDYGAPTGPVDNWQPEAITFLSLYLNPLFLCGLILMVFALYFLLLAQRTGCLRYSFFAGLCLLVLGNVHTYDVLTIGAVWIAYLIVLCVIERRFCFRTIMLSGLAALIALPSIAYQFHLYQIDEVFRARANSPAPSPPIWSYFAGYGLVLALAVFGGAVSVRLRESRNALILTWAIVGFAVPYLPIAQQRKLIMGLHIPLCLLCVYALTRGMERLPQFVSWAITGIVLLFSVNSNFAFLARDIVLLGRGQTVTHYAPYITTDEIAAMRWLKLNGSWRDTVFASPTFALFTPALSGHRVYYGHWSETPDYASKLREWFIFVGETTSERLRLAILKKTKARYYVSEPSANLEPQGRLSHIVCPVFKRDGVIVYELKFAK